MDVLDKYMEELSEDTSLDQFSMKDVQMKLPAVKHKWTGRLIRSKIHKKDLIKKKKSLVINMSNKLIEESPIKLSYPIAKQKVEQHATIIQIDDEISDTESIVEFLEKVERILSSMTFDIRNLTEIMKLETM
jgi:hypothetical protein